MLAQLIRSLTTAAALAALTPAVASAAVIDVNVNGVGSDNVTDDQMCTLREAVTAANTNSPVNPTNGNDCPAGEATQDLIELEAGDYPVTGAAFDDVNVSGDLDLNLGGGPVEVAGVGAASTMIDPNNVDRALHALGSGTLMVSDLRLDDGTVTGSNAGGGINGSNANANLVLDGVRVSFNGSSNSSGGGIFSAGNLTLISSEVDNNSAFSQMSTAGAAGIQANQAVTITDSTIHNNTVTTPANGTNDGTNIEGGAIFTGGTVTMSRSTVRDNSIVSSNTTRFPVGAGIRLLNGNATITDSTISGNTTSGGNNPSGGGISFTDNSGGPDKLLTIQNSTFSGNAPGAPAMGTTLGGAIDIFGGTVTVTNSTFTLNSALNGEDIEWSEPGGQNSAVTLRGSIFNEDGINECQEVAAADFTTAGHNVDRGTSCDLDSAGGTDLESQTALQIGLGATLASNGGPTMTHTISSTSVARDTIPQVDCDEADLDPLTADQRGVPRPDSLGGTDCDSGAYEYEECGGRVVNVVGTGGAETLIGTASSDGIMGLGGADTIQAGDSFDGVCAGDGDDTLLEFLDSDNDQFLGQAGSDTISFEFLVPASYSAVVASGIGTAGGTGIGTDFPIGVENATGSAGNDTLDSAAENVANRLDGGDGDDILEGKGGDDMLIGGANTTPAGDTVRFDNAPGGITANLGVATPQNTVSDGMDTITTAEGLIGSAFGDTLIGDALANTLMGGGGGDSITGNGAVDMMFGQAGADNMFAMDTLAETVDCGTETDGFSADMTDTLVMCETDLNAPPPIITPPPATPTTPTASENPECAILRAKLKKAKSKRKKRKIRKQLKKLGC